MRNPKTWVEIDRKAIAHNVREFRKLVKKRKLIAVVKSNAYGHGLVLVAKNALRAGADLLAVDSIDEALALREARIKSRILILGYTLKKRLDDVVRAKADQAVFDRDSVAYLARALRLGKKKYIVGVHVKVDTGTSRIGIRPDEVQTFCRYIRRFPEIRIAGVYTHFANIEDMADQSYACEQLRRFGEALSSLVRHRISVPLRHAACSAATLLMPETYYNAVRIGIGLYGLWPSQETSDTVRMRRLRVLLRPVLAWKTRVAQVKRIPRGAPVSYGLTERVRRDTTLAVLPLGYWDGYDRGLSRTGEVLIRGRRCKVLGRVCMNMTMVDATHVRGIKQEDEVVLIGKQGREHISADDIARKLGTIHYEVVTRINPSLPRIAI